MQEVWKDVKGFEMYLSVSNTGKVFGKRQQLLRKLPPDSKGYLTVSLSINGLQTTFKVHRLVAEAFLLQPSKKLVVECRDTKGHRKVLVRHLDNIVTNNHVSNLAWGTTKDNSDDKWKSGNGLSGVYHGGSVLVEDDVKYIRENYIPRCRLNGGTVMAIRFNVSNSVISNVVNSITY